MNIKNSIFIKSSTKISQLPITNFTEYAFIGRSNVGKSTLINVISNRNNFAKISSYPGKTQMINHFLINKKWYLVDLPGYGYAKISKKKYLNFQKLINNYINYRKNLMCLFVLIDIRLNAQKIDLEFLKILNKKKIFFCIVFTKTDKITIHNCKKNIILYNSILLKNLNKLPFYFKSSSIKKEGKIEILNYIEKLNKKWNSILIN